MPSKLEDRKSKAKFETRDTVFERGRHRPVMVELTPDYAILRLKKSRKIVYISWAGAYQFAVRNEAEKLRQQKKTNKKKSQL